MKKTLIVASILICGFDRSYAQPKANTDEARIEYLGGITLCANDTKALSRWYTEVFGIDLHNEYQGIYYGSIKFKGIELNMGIHPNSEECHKAARGLTMTFHVNNYERYLSVLKSKGLLPYKTEKDEGGQFAYFLDLENNQVAVWGN